MAYLEAACAELVAHRHTEEDRGQLTAAHAACIKAEKKNGSDAFYDSSCFHERIYAASHNEFVRADMLSLRNRLEAYRRASTFHAGLMALTIKDTTKSCCPFWSWKRPPRQAACAATSLPCAMPQYPWPRRSSAQRRSSPHELPANECQAHFEGAVPRRCRCADVRHHGGQLRWFNGINFALILFMQPHMRHTYHPIFCLYYTQSH